MCVCVCVCVCVVLEQAKAPGAIAVCVKWVCLRHQRAPGALLLPYPLMADPPLTLSLSRVRARARAHFPPMRECCSDAV